MRRIHSLLSLAIPMILAMACSAPPEEEEAALRTFDRFLAALDKADGAVLWELADDSTHAYFDALATEMRTALDLVDRHYPEAEKAAGRRATGGDYVNAASNGRSLFLAMLDPRKIAGPSDPAARKPVKAFEITDGTISVVLESGDTVDFQKDSNGNLRTRIFLKAFEELPALKTLRDNFAMVKKNAEVLSAPPPPAARTEQPQPAPKAGGVKSVLVDPVPPAQGEKK